MIQPTCKITRLIRTVCFTICLLMACAFTSQAQTLEQARGMIQKKDFGGAKIAFENLITQSQYKTRADVNKWYGEALYHTRNYELAEKHLSMAAKNKILGGILLLGHTQRSLYKFNEAIESYNLYKASLKPAKDQDEIDEINAAIKNCELLESASKRVEAVQVIDSIIVDKGRFFEYYKLSAECGRLLSYSAYDPKKGESGLSVFESQRKDKQYFGKINSSSKFEIVLRNKLTGNSWSEPSALPGPINSDANNNFPFVLTDGMTMYFASDREPSFGGYDLYVTQFNSSRNSYLTPEKLPMPFNSPFNDYMMAIDEENKVGWFASDRYQPEGKVVIYLFVYNFHAKKYYQDKTDSQLRSLAKIESIRDSWHVGVSYEKTLVKVYNQQKIVKKAEEPHFIVDDNIIYKSANEFRNESAREFFEKSRLATKALLKNREDIDLMRVQWLNTDPYGREEIKNKIFAIEKRIQELEYNIPIFETKARNLELEMIKKK